MPEMTIANVFIDGDSLRVEKPDGNGMSFSTFAELQALIANAPNVVTEETLLGLGLALVGPENAGLLEGKTLTLQMSVALSDA